MAQIKDIKAQFYRPRNPASSPFFQLVEEHFDDSKHRDVRRARRKAARRAAPRTGAVNSSVFILRNMRNSTAVVAFALKLKEVNPDKKHRDYSVMSFVLWRKIIRFSIDKFIKCGDLKEGFARVKCTKCGKEMFVAYSCRQRCCCPSCHQKRTLLFALHLSEGVLAEVPHRQFVFTIPKRLRIYFRYDRTLLGKLAHAAWETVRDVFLEEVGDTDTDIVFPAMVAGIQTFGDLINFHPHIHSIVPCGVFLESGKFIDIKLIYCKRVRF